MNVGVRRLTADDLGPMRELVAMFGVAFEDLERYAGRPPSDAYVRAFLERPDTASIAAFAGERVVGGLVAYVLNKFERERSEMYIYDLAVAEPYRRRGIARALIGELRRIAAQIGAYVIFVQADHGDDAAIALYDSLGTREDVLHFDIDVP